MKVREIFQVETPYAVVVLAALLNATRQTGAVLRALTVGVIGLGVLTPAQHGEGFSQIAGAQAEAP